MLASHKCLRACFSFANSEYSKYFAKSSVYHQKDKFLFNPRLSNTSEIIDNPLELDEKVIQLSRLLTRSKYAVCLTGAGLSTSSGIPDYRSGVNTVLPTGPGKWELEQNKAKYAASNGKPQVIHAINAFPSFSHLAMDKLFKAGLIKFIVTQNVDNLHHMSGVPRKSICELHGNIIAEKCSKCGKIYFRDIYTRQRHLKWGDPHDTGRICISNRCGGSLHDTLVFFGESVEADIKQQAQEEVEKADLLIVLGTSLTVQSAARLVWIAEKKQIPIVIVNLQKTSFDDKSVLRLGSFTDQVFDKLLLLLHLTVDPFKLTRELNLRFQKEGYSDYELQLDCFSTDGTSLSAIKSLEITHSNEHGHIKLDTIHDEPWIFSGRDSFSINNLKLNFFSNLNEKSYFQYPQDVLQHGELLSMSSAGSLVFLKSQLSYDFSKHEWRSTHAAESYK